MAGKMTLDKAIKHTWDVYQKQILAAAWAILECKDSCKECAEEHKQLYEWLKILKNVKLMVNDYKNGEIDAEQAMTIIGGLMTDV